MEKIQTYGKPEHKHHLWLWVFLIFVAILGFIIYTSFYNPELSASITGNIIKNNPLKTNQSSNQIHAKITPPETLSLNINTEKLSIKISEKSEIEIGNQKIDLKDKSSIIVDNFKGSLEINKNTIFKLNGKTTKIFINGVPITPKSGQTTLTLNPETKHSFLELIDTYLDKLLYTTSGTININNNEIILNPKNQKIDLNDFTGNLKIRKSLLELNGQIKTSSIDKLLKSVSEKEVESKSEEKNKEN